MSCKRAVLVVLVIGVFAGVSFLARVATRGTSYGTASMALRQGDPFRFDRERATGIDGRTVDWHHSWALVIFSESNNQDGIRRVRYASVLSRRYSDRGLAVLAILPGSPSNLAQIATENLISYPVVRDDGRWSARFGLNGHHYGLVLVNPHGEIEFASPWVSLENMRQLVEKHVMGTITYAPAYLATKVSQGAVLPPVPVLNIITGERFLLPDLGPGTVAFVSPACADCALNQYLAWYASIRRSKPNNIPKLVFSSRFNRDELRRRAAEFGLGTNIFLAADTIPGMEDETAAHSLLGRDAVVLAIDATGTVLTIGSWESSAGGAVAAPPSKAQSVGASSGASVGRSIGDSAGISVGQSVGGSAGSSVGQSIGDSAGTSVGQSIGDSAGTSVGQLVGGSAGISVGHSVGVSTADSTRTARGGSSGQLRHDAVLVGHPEWLPRDVTAVTTLKRTSEGYLLADTGNNRIVSISEDGRPLASVGSIGQRVGEFFEIKDMTVGANGYVYVLDAGGRRLQIFNEQRAAISQIRFQHAVTGICVDPKGRIEVGDPLGGSLVAVYDRVGHLLRRFGSLKTPFELYGGQSSLEKRTSFNRVRLACDLSGNTYVAFVGAPVIQKYDADGQLLFDKRLSGDLAALVVEGFLKRGRAPVGIAFGDEDGYTPWIITGLTLDQRHQRLYVSVQWDRSWLYVASSEGEPIAELDIHHTSAPTEVLAITLGLDLDATGGFLIGTLGNRLWTMNLLQ